MKLMMIGIITVLFISNFCYAETLINANFDTGVDKFVFRTDVYGNKAPVDRTIGSYDNSGRLHTYLGNGQRGGVGTLAAGWLISFTTAVKSDITITLVYQHRLSGKAETSEFSEVMCVINNVMYFPDNQTFISRFFGDGNIPSKHMDTGTVTATIHLTIDPGVHSFGLGFYLNQATAKDEWAEVYFDSVIVERTDFIPPVVDDENKRLVFENVVTVSKGNNKPITLYKIDEGENITFNMSVVDINDTTNIQQPTIRALPSGSTFEGGAFSWVPTSNQSGFYSLAFEFGSGKNYIYYMIDLCVSNNEFSIPADQQYNELITAVDPDGDDWEMAGVSLPAGSTLVGEKQFGPKLFSWKPTISQVGVHTFTIGVTDYPKDSNGDVQKELQLTDIRNFTITVTP